MTEQQVISILKAGNPDEILSLLEKIIEEEYDFTDGILFLNLYSTVKPNKALITAINKLKERVTPLFDIMQKDRFSVSGNEAFAGYFNNIISPSFQPFSLKAQSLDFFIDYALKPGNGIKVEEVYTNHLKGPAVHKVRPYIKSKIRGEDLENPYSHLNIYK